MPWRFLVFLYFAAAVLFAAQPASAQARPEQIADEAAPLHRDHGDVPARHRDVLPELLKQSVEQPLHFLMAAGPIWLSRSLTAVPWYGWSIVPVLAYREWRQWPSERWWDPLLDGAFLILGVIMATWHRGGMLDLRSPRRRYGRRGRALLNLAARRA